MFFLTILDTFDYLKNKANYITYFIKYQKHLHSISLISKFNKIIYILISHKKN